jgi:pyruvate/2-oxoglutarate dehydrogenase complex dihydrolipoamide dehydrogenase (E3) component
MARLVIRNALFFGSGKMSSLLIPWVTYTDPEIGHVGLYEVRIAQHPGLNEQSLQVADQSTTSNQRSSSR